ncbi:MAG TPA: hypothetical protein VMF30_01315, partial [Pirellulales bacterium]|nr:hypothetical protein [Pirellulales bacterium]
AQYQAALDSVTFSTTSTVTGTRSLTIEVSNGGGAVFAGEAVNVVAATAPGTPVVTPSGTTSSYNLGKSPVAVDSGLSVSSTETDLTGATLTIAMNTLAVDDLLNFTAQNGITGSYANGVLTLTGSATVAQYQAALDSVTFSTTSTLLGTRSISVVVDAGSLASAPVTENVGVIAPNAMHERQSVAPVTVTPPPTKTTTPITVDPPVSGQHGRHASVATESNSAKPASLIDLALAVGESSISASTSSATVANVSANVLPAASTTTTAAAPATPSVPSTDTAAVRAATAAQGRHAVSANDAAVGEFDLTDLYV